MERVRLTGLAAVPIAVAIMVSGCGSSASGASGQAPTTTTKPRIAAAANGALKVTTTEFAFSPMTATAKAGKLKLILVNDGKIPHELVLLKTMRKPDSLRVNAGRVSEAASVGEVSETAGGATKSKTLTLTPGSYVFVCNIPGHYTDGMRGMLTVQ